MTTKAMFLKVYRRRLREHYAWATNPDKMQKFMAAVDATLNGENMWSRSGEAYFETLEELGLPKNISLKELQKLPQR